MTEPLTCYLWSCNVIQGFNLRPLRMSDFTIVDSHAYSHVDPSGGRGYRMPGGDDILRDPVD